jgi:hypothetical protein
LYNNRKCPLRAATGGCKWTGIDCGFIEHVSRRHKLLTLNVEDGKRQEFVINVSKNVKDGVHCVIATLNEMFLQTALIKENFCHCIVQYIGARNDASKFIYKVSASCKEQSGQTSGYSGSHVVSSDSDTLEDICTAVQCVVIPCAVDKLKYYDKEQSVEVLKYFIEISRAEDTDA